MYETFFKYIKENTSIPLTEKDMELIKNSFVPKKLRKRQYFLQEGEVCEFMAFIVKGAMRQFSVDDKGVEHIVHLSIENWWVGDRESYINLTNTIYNIDAWEDSEFLQASRADFLIHISSIPAMNEMSRLLDERNAIANQRRLNAQISLTAEKRFAEFVIFYPEFLQRFPQHIIASYLGITKETLSRIRKQTESK